MRPQLAILALVLLIGLAAAAWFGLRPGGTGSGPEVAGLPLAGPGGAGSAGPDADLIVPGAAPAGRAEHVHQGPEGTGVPAPETDGPAPPPVAGRVIDEVGAPVAGARVLFANGEGAGLPLDMADVFRSFGESWDTTTDAQGRFEVSGPAPGILRIAVRAAGFAPYDRDDIRLASAPRHELETVVLLPGVVVTGRVLDTLGRPVAGAEFERLGVERAGIFLLGGERSGPLVATSGEDGGYRVDQLPAGPWRLRVRSQEHPDAEVEGEAARPGEEIHGRDVVLEPGYEIAGTVVGMPPERAEDVSVTARPGDRNPSPFARFGEGEVRRAAVARDGGFLLQGLRGERDYVLEAREKGSHIFGRGLSPAVPARSGDRGVELPFRPEAALVFQVIDGRTGRPLTDFEVSVGARWPRPVVDENDDPITHHPEGRVRAPVQVEANPGQAVLEIGATGYRRLRREKIPVRAGEELDLGVLRIEPSAVVSVSVLDRETREPVEGALVVLSRDLDPATSRRMRMGRSGPSGLEEQHSAVTDAAGRATLSSFEGEVCSLRVTHGAHAPWRGPSATLPIGEPVEREVLLGPGGSVLVRVAGTDESPMPGEQVLHQVPEVAGAGRMLGMGGMERVSDEAGEVLFDHLEPGLHRFRLAEDSGGDFFMGDFQARLDMGRGDGPAWSEVQVVEGVTAELVLTAAARAALFGTVREGGQLLSGATLSLHERREGSERDRMLYQFLGSGGGPQTRSDGSGAWRLEGIRAGAWTLEVTHPARQMPYEHPVDLAGVDLELDLDLPVTIIEGRVTDLDGKPLAGIEVWAEKVKGNALRGQIMISGWGGGGLAFGGSAGGTRQRTDGRGRYALRGLEHGQPLAVRAEGPDVQPGHSEELTLEPGEVRHGVDFELALAGRIAVSAIASDGSPGRNLIVTVRFAEGQSEEPPRPASTITDERGQAELTGLTPGRWLLSLRSYGPNRDPYDTPPEREVQVVGGETQRIDLEAP